MTDLAPSRRLRGMTYVHTRLYIKMFLKEHCRNLLISSYSAESTILS